MLEIEATRGARELVEQLPGDLRRQAYTHASWVAPFESYERLAFLGDVVLSLAVSDHLFPRFERYGAGRLTKVRAQAVSGASCARVAQDLGVPERLREGAPAATGRSVEVLGVGAGAGVGVRGAIGAAYLCFGIERTARRSSCRGDRRRPGASRRLQVGAGAAGAQGGGGLREGPPHDRSFVAVAEVGGQEVAGKERRRRAPSRLFKLWTGYPTTDAPALDSHEGLQVLPQRTKLEFAPGVSVVVGPNGSGKSNITDAVLWALGEQSPARRPRPDDEGRGGHGIKGSSSAEVEVVIDNGDRVLDSDFSEISIVRKLSRDGEGEYRLNGARCRLVDIIEVLSDSGLGKEMHSVVSQGKVEAIVLSRPRSGALIEEAAGLGKHRKPPPRSAQARANGGELLPGAGRGARGAVAPATAQAPGGGRGVASADRAPVARGTAPAGGGRRPRRACRAERGRGPLHRSERDEAERLLAAAARRRRRRSRRSRGCGSSSRAACLPLARRPSESASGSSGRATRRIPPPSAASVAARSSRSWRSSCAPTTVPPTPPAASPSWRPSLTGAAA